MSAIDSGNLRLGGVECVEVLELRLSSVHSMVSDGQDTSSEGRDKSANGL